MAFPQIETGYKPEFGLGAVYQGFNAANADQSAEMELIKQFLANQREQQMQPLDIQKAQLSNQGTVFDNMTKGLQGAQAQAQNNPAMLQSFLQDKRAGYNKNIRADELESILQPFKKEAAPSQGQQMVAGAKSDATLGDLQQRIITMPPGPEREALYKQYTDAVGTRGFTPEFWGKNEVENTKGYWDLEKAGVAASATRDAAHTGGKAAWAQAIGPATQEVKTLREQLTKLNSNEFSDQLAQMLITKGLKKGTPEYTAALETTKKQWRTELEGSLKNAEGQLRAIYLASGIGTDNPVPAATSSSATHTYVPGKGLVANN